jgi:hypothetical protein
MPPKKVWVKLTETDKKEIEQLCLPLVDEFKKNIILENPNKMNNYLVDIYLKWHQNYLYFCGEYKSEDPNRIYDEYEDRFVRLECIDKDNFNFSYFRFTGQWFLVAKGLTLKDCLDSIRENPNFHPIG